MQITHICTLTGKTQFPILGVNCSRKPASFLQLNVMTRDSRRISENPLVSKIASMLFVLKKFSRYWHLTTHCVEVPVIYISGPTWESLLLGLREADWYTPPGINIFHKFVGTKVGRGTLVFLRFLPFGIRGGEELPDRGAKLPDGRGKQPDAPSCQKYDKRQNFGCKIFGFLLQKFENLGFFQGKLEDLGSSLKNLPFPLAKLAGRRGDRRSLWLHFISYRLSSRRN